MRISPKPPENTVQEETINPLKEDSGYDNCTLIVPCRIPLTLGVGGGDGVLFRPRLGRCD